MCGIYGVFNKKTFVSFDTVHHLAKMAEVRGVDSSGLIYNESHFLNISKRDFGSSKLVKSLKTKLNNTDFIVGHSRLATNDVHNNQPVIEDKTILFHNGIITNYKDVWSYLDEQPTSDLDSVVLAKLFNKMFYQGLSLDKIKDKIFSICEGVISAIIVLPLNNKVIFLSNNGSLYYSHDENQLIVSSESFPLTSLNIKNVQQLYGIESFHFDFKHTEFYVDDVVTLDRSYLLPKFAYNKNEEDLLERYVFNNDMKRCTKCVLPETMPYISFDDDGVCNYCNHYELKNVPKPPEILNSLLEPYRRHNSRDCIVPFSGGRDSCYGLHLIVNEFKMKPIAYTYDWGMVTDLGRRNISRFCSKLGVENIIVAADIGKKRSNIRKNIKAWLKNPHLGMISLWTAGDKHFFKYCEDVKKQTGISLNLWGVNPMETTHFKTGFLGIRPSFENKSVYNNGYKAQLEYQYKRYRQYIKNPSYFNSSIYDTLSGEYWRSINKKTDYFHIFDYWTWDENVVNSTLKDYNWEWANDTSTSWRIGDGTAALYNYVYATVAGFTEHDTFRSNQIREGMISRDEALKLIKLENQPRYESIQWYLRSINLDFTDVISIINKIPKLYIK